MTRCLFFVAYCITNSRIALDNVTSNMLLLWGGIRWRQLMGRMIGKFRQARLDYASRLGRTVSVKEVAEKIGVSRQFFSDVEHNKERPVRSAARGFTVV